MNHRKNYTLYLHYTYLSRLVQKLRLVFQQATASFILIKGGATFIAEKLMHSDV